MYIKNLAFEALNSIIVPIKKKPIEFLSKILALLGGYYSLCEIEQAVLDTTVLLDLFRGYLVPFLLVVILISVFAHRAPLIHSGYLDTKDVIVSLRIADLLSIKGTAIVIPTNTTFDTTMDGDFISANSIQGQFQKKHYGTDFSELNVAIKSSLDEYFPNQYEVLNDRNKTNRNRYNIGTVAKVTKNGQHYYFLAVADVSRNGKPENVTMQSLVKAFVGLWDFISREGHTEPITIPVIGTGRAGLKDGTFEDVVHEALFSFISKSQDEFVSKKMTICIYPSSLSEANVTWERLCDYLDWQCAFFSKNQKHINASKAEGTPIGIKEK
jgi:hypothetical protein